MATALKAIKPAKETKPLSEFYVGNGGDRWDRRDAIFRKKDGKASELFSANVSNLNCCAFNEIHDFNAGFPKLVWSESLQIAFNAYIQRVHETNEGSYQIMILNREAGWEKPYQPDWLVTCLDNYPGAYTLPWTPNMTHRGDSEVKMYMLPTMQK